MKNLVHSKEESTDKKLKIKDDEPEEMFHLRLNKTHKKNDKDDDEDFDEDFDEDLDEDLDEINQKGGGEEDMSFY